jgi:hypothetical protein
MRYLAKIEKDKTEYWAQRAVEEAPGRREPLVDLAKYYYEKSDWEKCYDAAKAALEIKEKPLEYLCEDEAWGFAPHDYLAIAAFRIGKYKDSVEHGAMATQLVSDETEKQRLSSNLSFYVSALRGLSSEPAL